VADGVNVMETVQFAPGSRSVGQLSVSKNPSVVESVNPFSGLPPKLVMTVFCAGLVVPTRWEKFNDGGEKLIAEGGGEDTGTGVAPKT